MTKEELQAMLAELGVVTQDKLNSTAAMLRKQNEAIEGLTGIVASITEKKDDGTFSLKMAAPPAQKPDGKTPEWQAQLDAEKAAREGWQAKFEAEKQARESEQLKATIIASLEKAGAVNAGRDYIHVQGLVKRSEDGSFYVARKDEFGVENKVALDAAFGDFLKSNPELAKASTKSGSGTPAGSGGSGGAVNLEDMGSYLANREAIKSGKIQVS